MYVLWCCIELLVIEFVFCDSVVSFCFWHVCFVMLFSNVDKNIGGHRGLNWGMVKNQTQEHKTTLNARCVVKSKMMYGGNVPEPRCPFAVGLVATRPCFWLAAANLASSWRERRGGRRMLYRKTSNFPRFFTQLWTCWSSDARWISSKKLPSWCFLRLQWTTCQSEHTIAIGKSSGKIICKNLSTRVTNVKNRFLNFIASGGFLTNTKFNYSALQECYNIVFDVHFVLEPWQLQCCLANLLANAAFCCTASRSKFAVAL